MEIITSHTNTDLDALASMVAAQKLYPGAELVFPGKLSRNVEEFTSLHKDALNIKSVKEIDLKEITRIILVDTKNPRRINKLAEVLARPEVDVHIYDHHPWTDEDARGSLEVVEIVGATATLLVERIKEAEIDITPLEATIFAMGIYGDTGSLVFTNTTSRDAAAVAFLLEKGANLSVVSEFLGRPLTEEQKALLKTLLVSAERHQINGVKVLIARAVLEEFVVGLAMLTHTISEIERLDAVFTVVKMEDRVHVVGRSSLPQVNVADILSPFMGGGHHSAASATVKNGEVNEIAEKLVLTIQDKVKPPLAASDIMSSPVKTVHRDMSMAEAGQVMLRYGHSGLPVVEGDKLVGVISRRDVEKASHHGLGHAPVKGFMTTNVIRVSPNMPVSELQELMIENDIGRVPVVQEGKIIGLVSRTDVLRTLHGDYHNNHQKVYDENIRPVSYYKNISEVMRRGLDPRVLGMIQQAGAMAAEMGCRLYAAGGVVRDLLVGYENIDVDLVVEGDGIALAERMAGQLGAKVRIHPKFRTAEIVFDDGFKVDVATARVEYYEYPAALPQVESSSLRQDLYRRDFTINAMAVALNEDRFGDLVDYFGGREDLQYGLVRVLYNLSFIEDPTRILRAVRFEQRYHINIEPQTLKLIKEAVKQKVLARVSRERLWDEIYHILLEPEAGKMLSRLNSLGVWPQVFPGITYWEVQPVLNGLNRSIKMLRQWGFTELGEKWMPYMIAILHWSEQEVAEQICKHYNFSNRQTEKIITTLNNWREALARVWRSPNQHRVSSMAKTIMLMPKESYPLLLTILEEEWMRVRLRQILTAIRDNKPQVNGKFLKKMGYKPGPLYRDALDELWRERVDGRVKNEEEEKAFLIKFFNDKGVKPCV